MLVLRALMNCQGSAWFPIREKFAGEVCWCLSENITTFRFSLLHIPQPVGNAHPFWPWLKKQDDAPRHGCSCCQGWTSALQLVIQLLKLSCQQPRALSGLGSRVGFVPEWEKICSDRESHSLVGSTSVQAGPWLQSTDTSACWKEKAPLSPHLDFLCHVYQKEQNSVELSWEKQVHSACLLALCVWTWAHVPASNFTGTVRGRTQDSDDYCHFSLALSQVCLMSFWVRFLISLIWLLPFFLVAACSAAKLSARAGEMLTDRPISPAPGPAKGSSAAEMVWKGPRTCFLCSLLCFAYSNTQAQAKIWGKLYVRRFWPRFESLPSFGYFGCHLHVKVLRNTLRYYLPRRFAVPGDFRDTCLFSGLPKILVSHLEISSCDSSRIWKTFCNY